MALDDADPQGLRRADFGELRLFVFAQTGDDDQYAHGGQGRGDQGQVGEQILDLGVGRPAHEDLFDDDLQPVTHDAGANRWPGPTGR